MRTAVAVPALVVLALAACARTPPPAPTPPASPPLDAAAIAPTARTSPLVAELPAALIAAAAALEPDAADDLFAFYAARNFAPVWFDGGALAPHRATLAPATATGADAPASGQARVDREVASSLAARRVAAGDAAPLAPAAHATAVAFERAVAAAAAPSVEVAAFGGHARAVARYRTIAAAGGWPSLPAGATVEPGDSAADLDRLRRRLGVGGDLMLGAAPAGDRYDPALVAAVKRFQSRHGLEADGVIGPATRRALNVPAATRLAQLEEAAAAVAELRTRLEDRYVLVNLPAFELRYVRGGEVRHRARVVVGSVENPTPAFADVIEHLIFNPYWHVPASIAREELVFDFKADAAAMAARGFELIDSGGAVAEPTAVDWNTVTPASLPYRVRQGPGAGNALGRVKFMFPNRYAIYLHDTPSRHLFERASRAFSHGCIRVRDPLTLAERLLETDGWGRGDIEGWIAAGRTRQVVLSRPVPVHLVYVRAWRDAAGRVQFRRDIYGRDAATAS
ncbi:MAG: L,D-transpeptidase family protein [Alphaproteobacteria bacterium]|jgi:murein L,D-transpeptidase YcbB/YkuD|nr:L,D-transpeptidase family protein [Alphaproteobacteria bacterium]